MKAGVVLADCPWHFETFSAKGEGRSPQAHYQTMSIEMLKALPVASIAADDCALFFWAIAPLLPQAIEIGEAWGFQYKTVAFTWAKLVATRNKPSMLLDIRDDYHWHLGTGYYTRANPEYCLLFTRGKVKRKSRSVRQLVVEPVAEHSRKPDEIHKRIEQLIVCEQRVELFARRKRAGWRCLGNGIDGRDIYESIAMLAAE